MRWACAAPLSAWCCCARGMNCGKRWKATRRSRQEGLHERNQGKDEASGRDDLPAVPRAAVGPRARAGSFPAHARVRELPHPAAGARARIAAADPGDVRGQRTAAVAAGAVPGGGAALHAMDLGTGVWIGGNWRLCAVYDIHRTLAGAIARGGLQRDESAGPADFPEPLLERMAIRDHTSGVFGGGDPGWPGLDVP